MSRKLHIDIETYSSVSLADCGVYRYASSPDFRVLLLAYAWDEEPVRIVDIESGEEIPDDVLEAILGEAFPRGTVRCCAHNAAFERVCLSSWLVKTGEPRALRVLQDRRRMIHPAHWECSMVLCSMAGLPLSLAAAGAALGLRDQKMTEGKKLIAMFCVPQPVKAGLFQTESRLRPSDNPEAWALFKTYCMRDVEVEREICRRLDWVDVPNSERILYAIDQLINDHGVLVDVALAGQAARFNEAATGRVLDEIRAITGLGNPGSVPQLRRWVEGRLGTTLPTFDKTAVADLLASPEGMLPDDVRRVLELRQQAGRTSNAKWTKMTDLVGGDCRARGLFQFYGSRTGRWAGRFVQLQNLRQNHLDSLALARQTLEGGDFDLFELGWGDVPDTLSQLLRTAFIAPEGMTLAVCDFSAIEARVLAWLAGEGWVLDAFRAGQDLYCTTASKMFGVPVEKHGVNAHLRQKGKIATLALGYQGGVGALDAMGGQRMGLSEDEEGEMVRRWRAANPAIVAFWAAVEQAARECITYMAPVRVKAGPGQLVFQWVSAERTMTIQLPSGRKLSYRHAAIGESGRIVFEGVGTSGAWGQVETYGGKLTENITQAVARDCLAEVLREIYDCGGPEPGPVCMHIHDELVVEVPEERAAESLEQLERYFSQEILWAPGLPLSGAGYLTKYYLKD